MKMVTFEEESYSEKKLISIIKYLMNDERETTNKYNKVLKEV